MLAALVMVVLAACGGGDEVAGLPQVQEIVVTGEAQLPLDATTRLQATLRGPGGESVAGRPIYWSTSDPAVATVDQTGLVTPVAIGRVQVAASADGRSGVFDLQVVRKRVRTVDLAAVTEVAVGDTIVAEVSIRAADGGAVPGIAPTFSSTAPEIATVTSDGRIVGRSPGSAGIVASADGVADTTSVTVVPARVGAVRVEPEVFELTVGQTLPLRVTMLDRAGAPLAGRTASYSSSATAIATVDGGGVVRAVAPGSATITATSGGMSGTSRISVVAPPAPPTAPPTTPPPPPAPEPVPASLTISPNVVALQVGATRALSVTLRDSDGDVVTGRSVAWTSSAPSIAGVSATGVVTAVAPGAAVITAVSAGITASAGVTVTSVPVARVDVAPADVALTVGGTQQLSATPRAADGAALSGRVVTWSSSAASVATVSSTGDVRAVGAGTATITATVEGREGTARVAVTAVGPPPPPPPVVPGAPARLELVSGDGQRGKEGETLRNDLTARVVDANGTPVPGVLVLWATLDGGRFMPPTSTSDEAGIVRTRWRLGDGEGRQTATAIAVGLAPLLFSATAEDD